MKPGLAFGPMPETCAQKVSRRGWTDVMLTPLLWGKLGLCAVQNQQLKWCIQSIFVVLQVTPGEVCTSTCWLQGLQRVVWQDERWGRVPRGEVILWSCLTVAGSQHCPYTQGM